MSEPTRDRWAVTFWLTAIGVAGVDLWTKAIVRREIPIGDPPMSVVGDWVRWFHLRNSGGLFGVMPGNAVYFAVVTVIAIAVILYLVYRSGYRAWPARVALGGVLGGAVGNFHDRIRYGGVVDFVDVGFGSVRFPTFNVADAGVTVGVVLLAWWLFRGDPAMFSPEEPSIDDDDSARTHSVDGRS